VIRHGPLLIIVLGLGLGEVRAAEEPVRDRNGLKHWMDAHLAQPRFMSAAWGVKIVSLASGATLYEENAGKLLKPASNAKLYTGALALDRLGPNYQIRTSFFARQRPDSQGTISGDLIIYGRGAPSFAARFNNGNHTDNLRSLSQALLAAGVKRVQGNLICDESYFRGAPLGSGWMWDDLENYYGAEVSALTVEDNTVDLVLKPGDLAGAPVKIFTLPSTSYLSFSNRATTRLPGEQSGIRIYRPLGENIVYLHGGIPLGSSNVYDAVTVHRPALWFGGLLKESLARQSIVVGGTVRAVDWLDREVDPLPAGTNGWREIAFVESPPLKEILPRMMKPSQNLYAHLLLLQVGARVLETNASFRTTENGGLAEMEKFLQEAGIRGRDVLMEEGSGLSRGTLLTPNATIQLLTYMNRHPQREVYRAALPVAGIDGTLRRRMKGTPAAENVRAKTGTLRYVYALSGYVTTAAGEPLAFCLMLNNYDADESEARPALDAIAVMLSGITEKL
jgi:D-alanyl-D-alanine carboxypeptidase/D-alanyl-D-alanine-endopeptidase (penicillin-binding protein 4)